MKNLFKTAIVAIAAFCLTNCAKDQSSFDVSDIKNTAKILGTISYDLGQDYRNGAYINNIQPAANKKVYIEIQNSSLSPNGQATGVTVYETVTDEKGEYSIEIPAVRKGTQATISAEKFIAIYKDVVSVSNGTPVYDETEALFSVTPKSFTLKPNDIAIGDVRYTTTNRDEQNEYPYNSTFSVKVGAPQYYIATNENNSKQINMTYVAKGDANVIVTINGKKYGATTNGDGIAKFTIPAK
ncbi:MAG: hypothetical protein IJY44_08110 [Bacteroidaceae bacterium]|nr:hypothetical protein [Bacteroidaceae bacterium]